MNIVLKNGQKYSFSPDEILNGSAKNAYRFIDQKKFINSLELFYKCLGKLDKKLDDENKSVGLKRSIINEIFVNSSIFFFIYFFEHKKIKNKISKINIIKNEIYLKLFIKKYLNININEAHIKKKLKYNKIQILKQLNKKEIFFYIKKKLSRIFNTKKFNQIIYKECPLLINEINSIKKKNFFLMNDLKINQFKIKKKKIKKNLNCFNEFINSYPSRFPIKKIIFDLYDDGFNKYYNYYNIIKKNIKNFNIENYSNFHSSQLTSAKDFALLDLMKDKFNSKIITYQHGHGQGLSNYHDKIKYIKETSYSDINHVFSNNAKNYNSKNNSFSISKTIINKYHYPYNKFLTKLNSFSKFDIIYFSPWHMNGTNHSLYNYGINDLRRIDIESDLIKNYLSRSNYNILVKKYPYDLQKYASENHISNLISKHKNLTFYNKTLKYPEFYKKNQIILLFGCSSTFGYLASFNNPIIMVNIKDYFPVKKNLKSYFKKSIFLVDYASNDYKKLLEKLIYDKKYIYQEWQKKTIHRKKFYKKFLGIV